MLRRGTVKQLYCYSKFYFDTCPVGWLGGWVYELKIRLNSASVEVEVEVEAELGNIVWLSMQQSCIEIYHSQIIAGALMKNTNRILSISHIPANFIVLFNLLNIIAKLSFNFNFNFNFQTVKNVSVGQSLCQVLMMEVSGLT